MITDPIADSLTRIRNAISSRHKTVELRHSKFVERIIRLFYKIGYIGEVKVKYDKIFKKIELTLKYDNSGNSVLTGLKRISKPGLRNYCNRITIPSVQKGIGTAIISTSQGLMTTYQAKKKNIGGEVICFIWW